MKRVYFTTNEEQAVAAGSWLARGEERMEHEDRAHGITQPQETWKLVKQLSTQDKLSTGKNTGKSGDHEQP